MTPRSKSLNNTDMQVYNYIIDYWAEFSYSPSIRDIVDNTRLKSTSHVRKILRKLRNNGLITMEDRISRSIVVVGSSWRYDG